MFYFAEDAPNWTLNVAQSEKLQKIHSGEPGREPTKGGELTGEVKGDKTECLLQSPSFDVNL